MARLTSTAHIAAWLLLGLAGQETALAQSYLSAQHFADAVLPQRFADKDFQARVRATLSLNYPRVDWSQVGFTTDKAVNRFARRDWSVAMVLQYGAAEHALRPGYSRDEVAYSITGDPRPAYTLRLNCGQPAADSPRRATTRQESEADRTDRIKRTSEANVTVSVQPGPTGGFGSNFSLKVTAELERIEREKVVSWLQIDDSIPIRLPENGFVVLVEDTSQRTSRLKATGTAIVSAPITVTYYSGSYPFAQIIPIGEWADFDAADARSVRLETEVLIQTAIKTSGTVHTSGKYNSSEECARAAKDYAPSASGEPRRITSPIAGWSSHTHRANAIAAFAAMDSSRVCNVRARAVKAGSSIQTTFSIDVPNCVAPKRTSGQLRYAFRYLDAKGQQQFVRNYTSRWRDREPPSFTHQETDQPPRDLDNLEEVIEAEVVDCECK